MNQNSLDEKLTFYDSLLQNSVGTGLWIFNSNMELEYSHNENAQFFINIMQLSDGYSEFLSYLNSGSKFPLILSTDLSLIWIAIAYHMDSKLAKVYMIGPVFKTFLSESSFRQYMQTTNLSLRSQMTLYRLINSIPISDPSLEFGNLGCMLYYILFGERIKIASLKHMSVATEISVPANEDETYYHNSEHFEALMLRNVEEGNLDFETLCSKYYSYGVSGRLAPGNPLRQKKNEMIAMTALISRAAVRGGVPYELALTTSDIYLQHNEMVKSENEVEHLQSKMYNDFVNLVQQAKQKTEYSKSISELMTILDSSLTVSFSIENAASQLGYSKYYLTQQFKKETGISVNDYLRNQRIEYSKILLRTTNEDITEISKKLHFASSSYFSKNFKLITGMSPSEYRNTISSSDADT